MPAASSVLLHVHPPRPLQFAISAESGVSVCPSACCSLLPSFARSPALPLVRQFRNMNMWFGGVGEGAVQRVAMRDVHLG